MKRLLMSGLLIAAGLPVAALAADLPTRKEAPAPARVLGLPVPASWTGFYVGAYGGLNWLAGQSGGYAAPTPVVATTSRSTLTSLSTYSAIYIPTILPAAPVKYGRSGLARPEVGALAGYLYDMGRVAVGVEANAGYSWARGRAREPWSQFDGAERAGLNGALRARFGVFSPNKQVLFYGVGGVAFSQIKRDFAAAPLAFADKGNRTGWTAGAGAEGFIWGPIRLRAEYAYENFGSRKTEIHKARLGLTTGF